MTWSHVTKVEKIKTRLGLMDRLQREWQVGGFGAMDRVVVKLEQDLEPTTEPTKLSKRKYKKNNHQSNQIPVLRLSYMVTSRSTMVRC
jgi:hypothetical protein